MQPNDQLLMTPIEAAAYLRLTVERLAKMRLTGGATPKFYKLGGSVRYRKSDLDEWVESCLRTSTSDSGEASPAQA